MTPLRALQATLAGEHAAVYVYGVLAAQVSTSAEPSLARGLNRAYDVHLRQRDELTGTIARQGADPVAAAVAYALPNAAATAAQQRSAALVTERRCAGVYGQLVGATSGTQRGWGITALTACAARELTFGGDPENFPGLT